MNQEKYDELRDILTQQRLAIHNVKRDEYASHENVFDNFKREAENLGLNPFQVWAVYASKHFHAIMTYVRDESHYSQTSEPIEERISDLMNYLELLYGMIKEKTSKEKTS